MSWTLTIPTTIPLRVSASALGTALIACGMLTSSFVSFEPAPTDALMLMAAIALPMLGFSVFGPLAATQLAIWMTICALGIFAAGISPHADASIKHNVVTLFLAIAAFAVASFLRERTAQRFNLLVWCFTLSAAAAAILALIGYFDLVPGSYDLFTRYGRARGPYKDPNVFGAALVLALAFLSWTLVRGETQRPLFAGSLFVVLIVGVLISFSRGAWMAAALTLAIVGISALVFAVERSHQNRICAVAIAGTFAISIAVGAALQSEKITNLLAERASFSQGYDVGPSGRFGGQRKAAALIVENPLGIGNGVFSSVYHHEAPHQVYLSMFLNSGWVGGLLFLISVLSTLAIGGHGILTKSQLRGPFVIATAALAATLVLSLVIDSDHWRHLFIVMGLIWGLSDAKHPSDKRSRKITPA
ncbi:MAG: O-antigen ligase family protein [Pseudomonadota bacterium]